METIEILTGIATLAFGFVFCVFVIGISADYFKNHESCKAEKQDVKK